MKLNNMDKTMRTVVGTSFIRVMKNNGLYNIFIDKANTLTTKGVLHPSDSHPFAGFHDFNDLMSRVEVFTNKNLSGRDKYEKITMMINHMLHFFIEGSKNMTFETLNKLGEETFNLSCHILYGDKYKEELREKEDSLPEDFDEFASEQYEMFILHQNDATKMSYPDFIQKFKRPLLNIYNSLK